MHSIKIPAIIVHRNNCKMMDFNQAFKIMVVLINWVFKTTKMKIIKNTTANKEWVKRFIQMFKLGIKIRDKALKTVIEIVIKQMEGIVSKMIKIVGVYSKRTKSYRCTWMRKIIVFCSTSTIKEDVNIAKKYFILFSINQIS